MEINNDILLKNGFKCDNINNPMTKFYLTNNQKPEWEISIYRLYKPYSNKMIYNVDCWICNDNGSIIKKSSLSNVDSISDLQKIIDLCKINYKLKQVL